MASGQTGISGGEIECHLYSYDYSLCSLMTRYMIAVRGQPRPGDAALRIDDTEIDIHDAFDQLNEWYLRDISPQGQVPAFRLETKPPTIIADSLEIAEFFLQGYPSLQAPARVQEAQLKNLLKELHQLDYFAICFTATNAPVSANPRIHAKEETQKRLDDKTISPEYREALNHKLQVLNTQFDDATGPGHAAKAMEEAHTFFSHIEEIMDQDGPWIWGKHGPTALDTHTIAFLARLQDVDHKQFFTEKMALYYERAVQTEAWKQMIQGRSTMG